MRRVTGVESTLCPSPFPEAAALCVPDVAPADFGGAAWAGAAGWAEPPSTSSTTSVSCTLAISPSLPMVRSTFPRRGLGMVTVALSVITSTSGWSSTISSPAFTSHLTISPSTTPSPTSGSLNSNWAIGASVQTTAYA